ncbi:peptide/nickel transport system permease [Thermosulfidibacter takaii ABI70S6]|uniref:Peptide/nickel transport system permease n=1 Tax=Thermosulfidibacter takaii (strain DSM 17441 / JCM 13301 / NBRC 103674 / ABI70S6) TaxID=1298851 RepID=A0A0S3QSP5_THET7|nr:ABC transporter permease [Thermosulfidibacter takaii]BAT71354.1 peptide/nickel transport system permease [Thermosulfidibacter takaii ABI70S6]
MLRAVIKNRLAFYGLLIVILVIFLAVFAPWIAPYDYAKIDPKAVLMPPSWRHPFGTDHLGRDVLSRIIWGARVSVEVGVVSVGIATVVGTFLGAISGYFGGWVDEIIMRFVDIMLCFPTFFLILAVISVLEPSIINIMVVIGLTSWMGVARLVRAEVLSLKEREFVLSARVSGLSAMKIILRHIIPNSMGPVLVAATLGVGSAILVESALSFLGIGVQPPTPSWGSILASGKDTIQIAWWLSFFPGCAILITVLGYNLLGEGLRDVLDPKLIGVKR